MSGFALVDKVKAYATSSDFPTTGKEGILYIDISTGIIYLWNGSSYEPVADNLWILVGSDIQPQTDGHNLDMLTGEGTFTTGLDSVEDITNSSGVSKAKLNSAGVGYHVNNFGFGTTTPSTTVSINGGISRKMTDAGAADYNPSALTTDYKITTNNTAAARNVIISTEDIATGTATEPREFLVSDYYGQAGVNAITVSGESGTINGAASIDITSAYGSMHIHSDGTNLTIV